MLDGLLLMFCDATFSPSPKYPDSDKYDYENAKKEYEEKVNHTSC